MKILLKIFPIVALMMFATPSMAFAAIAFDAASAGSAGTGTSGSFTSNTVTGSNTIGVVMCGISDSTKTAAATWNGVSMTATASSPLTVGSNKLYFFYILNPASASSIALSFSGSLNWWCTSDSYTGVDQTSPIDQEGTTVISVGTSLSKTLTSLFDNEWGVSVFLDSNNTNAITAAAGTTKRTSTGNGFGIGDSGPVTPAGSVTNTYTTVDSAATQGMVMVTLKPATATPTASNFGTLLFFGW